MSELLRVVVTRPAPIASQAGSHAFEAGRLALTGGRPRDARLTPRELEVLELLARGLQNKQICRELHIASGTVKAHVTRILEKLQVATRLQAVVIAMQRDLVPSQGGAREPQREAAAG